MRRTIPTHTALAGLGLLGASATALAGGGGIEISFYTDTALDCVFRCSDEQVDGTYHQLGETRVLYSDLVAPPLVALVPLSDPTTITVAPDDTVFVGDTTEDLVLALNDFDEDGTANESGEHWIYFDGHAGGNYHGLTASRITGLANRIALGAVWVACANTSLAEHDQILRLEDRNLDLDANDFDEARVYWSVAESALAEHEFAAVREGADGALYVLDVGSATSAGRGIYRLEDLDASGVIDQPGEVQPFFLPALAPGADLVAIDSDDAGHWYVLDRAAGSVWRGLDADASGQIDAGEAAVFWSFFTPVDAHDLGVTDEGGIFVGDAASPTRLRFGDDANADAVVDPGEEFVVYDDTLALEDMDAPHGVAVDFHVHGSVGDPFCTATSTTACPCNNSGTTSSGCANSTGAGGLLEGEGSTGVGNDDLELHAHELPPGASAIAYWGFATLNAGQGLAAYDGVRCVAGPLRRLGMRQADASGFAAWGPGLAASQGWAANTTLYFQVFYRDPAGPCGTTASFTNALGVTLDP